MNQYNNQSKNIKNVAQKLKLKFLKLTFPIKLPKISDNLVHLEKK